MRCATRNFVIAAFLVSLGIAVLLSPFASSYPDGLVAVAGTQHFIGLERENRVEPFALLPHYSVPFIGNSTLSTSVAGLIGTGMVFLLGFGLARLISQKRDR